MERDMDDTFFERYGPWTLVTGAAQGIGRAFCEDLLARGLSIVALDVRADALEQAVDRLRDAAAARQEVEPLVCDLSSKDVADRIAAGIAGRDLGLVVHCAAHIPAGPFAETAREEHELALRVNARAPLLTAHALLPSLRRRRRSGMIFVSSMAALQGTGWVATYAATKAFELVLAESLWWELRADGVDVLAVLPGATDTEGLRSRSPHIDDPSVLARPSDVAREALDRLGSAPSWICGEQNRALAEAMRTMPREQAIDLVSSGTRRMAKGGNGE